MATSPLSLLTGEVAPRAGGAGLSVGSSTRSLLTPALDGTRLVACGARAVVVDAAPPAMRGGTNLDGDVWLAGRPICTGAATGWALGRGVGLALGGGGARAFWFLKKLKKRVKASAAWDANESRTWKMR